MIENLPLFNVHLQSRRVQDHLLEKRQKVFQCTVVACFDLKKLFELAILQSRSVQYR
jgi:hypothetical protein